MSARCHEIPGNFLTHPTQNPFEAYPLTTAAPTADQGTPPVPGHRRCGPALPPDHLFRQAVRDRQHGRPRHRRRKVHRARRSVHSGRPPLRACRPRRSCRRREALCRSSAERARGGHDAHGCAARGRHQPQDDRDAQGLIRLTAPNRRIACGLLKSAAIRCIRLQKVRDEKT